MKVRLSHLVLPALLFSGYQSHAQANLTAWQLNNTVMAQYYYNTSSQQTPNFVLTALSTPADVQRVCYTTDSIWIETAGMARIMGPYLNPGTPTDQGFVWRIPRNPSQAANPVEVPNVFSIGTLINGIPVFGTGDATSYNPQSNSNVNNGAGLWNVDAWYGEGISLDTAYGAHVNQDGTYHSHATPFDLYSDDSTQHSPLVGFAFDGYPIYGPYGYSTATNSSSGTRRMKTSYRLRSITQRTTLPDGSTSTPPGPNVSNGFPLGMYIEDYEYVSGLGDLDSHNGRYCVTPEYPGGTYAYFVAIDANGGPTYPYYLGTTFYGNVEDDNLNPQNTITVPASVTNCLTPAGIAENDKLLFNLFPNPAQDRLVISLPSDRDIRMEASFINMLGETVQQNTLVSPVENLDVSSLATGVYHLQVFDRISGMRSTRVFVKY